MSADPQPVAAYRPAADPAGDELAAFYRDLAAVDVQPLWTIAGELLTPTPRPKAVPWLWSARTMRPLAQRAVALVPIERGGERRVLSLSNPGLAGRPYAAGTLWAALQCLGPHESAPAHRHTPGAIRFVLTGDGVWTTVDGDACDMHPGDLVLTPAWSWHDHTNGGAEPMLWFDGLDLPMIDSLDGIFFEPYPEDRQAHPEPHNQSEARHRSRAATLTADRVTDALDPTPSPLLVYRWSDTDAELSRLAAARYGAMAAVEFVNPRSGASVLPTLGCFMYRLTPGRQTAPRQRTGNAVYVVYRGDGHSVIDGQRFDWSAGDIFVVPSWAPVEHLAATPADLFAISDTPVHRALGIYRERVLPRPQEITGIFRPR
jgi:gentisate 1,2-dioxygenase